MSEPVVSEPACTACESGLPASRCHEYTAAFLAKRLEAASLAMTQAAAFAGETRRDFVRIANQHWATAEDMLFPWGDTQDYKLTRWTVDEATADPTTPTLREAARRLDLLATCVAWVSRDRARRDIIESGRAYRVGDRELLAQACEHLEARANDDVRITIDALKTRLGKTP